VLVELGVVEQRLSAVLEVLNDGVSVTEVAERFGVTRQSVGWRAWSTSRRRRVLVLTR